MSDLIERKKLLHTLTNNWDGMVMSLFDLVKNLPPEQLTPCDVCRHYPPSCMDAKPCCACPAEGGVDE